MNFGYLVGSADLPTKYPIYGNLLKIKLRNLLIAFDKKMEKVRLAIPKLNFVVKNYCQKLPDFCAEMILWNLSCSQLDEFVAHKFFFDILSIANQRSD